ncbi:MAG: hypothetical protein IBJ00_01210 [Alphaproteobacteria bacterium]|nr:hypothetical protein [Alphaproteobacteria bacterium]
MVCSAPKRLDRHPPHHRSESDDIPEWKLGTLPDELIAVIVSSLPRKDQVSVRRVSCKIKEIIDGYAWPKQSCTLRGECLSLGIDAIKSLPFRSLTLRFKRWKSEDIQSLGLLRGPTPLNMDSNQIGDAGAEALSTLTGLIYLYLDENQIGDAGVEALSKMTALKVLALYHNPISDAGIRELKKLSDQGIRVRYGEGDNWIEGLIIADRG